MRSLVAAILGLLVVAGPAHAILIDFDNDGPGATPPNVIGGFYSPLGVTFSGATWQDNLHLAGTSGDNALASTNANASKWTSLTPVVATFSFAVASVTLNVIDLGSNQFIINAYDAMTGGNLVGTVFRDGDGTELGNGNFQVVTIAAPSILRVEFFQARDISPDGIFVDNFQFAAVPEPGTLALLTLGLIGGGVARRRLTSAA